MPRRRFPQQNPTQTEAGIARPCHAGEPGPPLTVASPARAQHHHPTCSSDLRVSRSSFCTRPQPKWPTGAPERPAPASSPPRSSAPAVCAASPRAQTPSRPILNRRSRLDPDPGNPEPSDLDPMGQIQTYPFALLFLLKRPPVSFKSTRNPQPFKINYSLVQILANSPLSFLNFEPAVLLLFFYELDPGSIVYLRFSPRF